MRKNFGAKPYSYPQPVFIVASYDENGIPDAMNAAWGGICDEKEILLCLNSEHKTVSNILGRGAFTVSMADVKHIAACDYLGIVSANDEPHKFEKSGLHAVHSEFVDAPLITDLAVALECKLISYNWSTGKMLGEIVNVSVDEAYLDEEENADPFKAEPVVFDPFNNTYMSLGDKVGDAFSIGDVLIN